MIGDKEFVDAWNLCGCSPARVQEHLGISIRAVYGRRASLAKCGVFLPTSPGAYNPGEWTKPTYAPAYERETHREIVNGSVVIGSDAHIWPGEPSIAMRAFIATLKVVKPVGVILNGDVFDGAKVSRHARIGWAQAPYLKDEMSAVSDFVSQVEKATKARECFWHWNMGNHDLRFDNYLSARAGEMEGMDGMRLSDHYPRWDFAWSLMVNPEAKHPVMIKHRNAGGVHAGYNNTMKGGVTIVTGHTHLLEAKPWGDYRGRRWGIQTGSLADLHGPAFEYHENAPSSACSGFVVLTWQDGTLLPPELCEVIDGKAWFRGKSIG